MPATVSYKRVTHQEVVVKITGNNADTATVDLDVDLFPQGAIQLVTSGTIATNSASALVSGTTTAFTQEMVGGMLYDGTDGPYLGTILSVEDATNLTLTDVATDTYSGPFGISYRTQELHETHEPAVTIVSAVYTGTGIITIERDNEVIMILNAAAANGKVDLLTAMVPDDTNLKHDIDVTFTSVGADLGSQLWLKLRKVGGWDTRIEPAYYGAHDDETKVGS